MSALLALAPALAPLVLAAGLTGAGAGLVSSSTAALASGLGSRLLFCSRPSSARPGDADRGLAALGRGAAASGSSSMMGPGGNPSSNLRGILNST